MEGDGGGGDHGLNPSLLKGVTLRYIRGWVRDGAGRERERDTV